MPKLGVERVRQLIPLYLKDGPVIVSGHGRARTLEQVEARNLHFDPGQAGASVLTAWVRSLHPSDGDPETSSRASPLNKQLRS